MESRVSVDDALLAAKDHKEENGQHSRPSGKAHVLPAAKQRPKRYRDMESKSSRLRNHQKRPTDQFLP
eukprot:2824349-Alexandrium_andersonii.AAC.1